MVVFLLLTNLEFLKLHAAGKTDQAKLDLARLAKIRKEREEAQAKRKAEAEGLLIDIRSVCQSSNHLFRPTAKAKELEEKKKTSGARAKR